MKEASQAEIFKDEVEPFLESWADIEGPYRYALGRGWGDRAERVCWVMLNPSTADATVNDPTIRKCIGYSRQWGFGAMVVVNLFALRATNPRELLKVADPIGPRNDEVLSIQAATARTVVVAWGTKGILMGRDRKVLDRLPPVRHLGLTKDGHPKHPLYLRGDLQPTRWDRA